MHVGEEGVSIVELNPDPYIQKWYRDKVRLINGAKPRNYPSKRWSAASSSGHVVIDITLVTLSDLGSSEDKFTEFWITIVKLCRTLFFTALQQA